MKESIEKFEKSFIKRYDISRKKLESIKKMTMKEKDKWMRKRLGIKKWKLQD